MPYNDPEPNDPTTLVGLMLPADAAATREMAYTFAEEFATRGEPFERIVNMFRNPFYAGPHLAWQTLGASEVETIIREVVNVFAGLRVTVRETPEAGGGLVCLPKKRAREV